jgi:hypothetical protein
LSAIHGKADYLLTGDAYHFEHLYGKRIRGVLVLRPAQIFRAATARLMMISAPTFTSHKVGDDDFRALAGEKRGGPPTGVT